MMCKTRIGLGSIIDDDILLKQNIKHYWTIIVDPRNINLRNITAVLKITVLAIHLLKQIQINRLSNK